jgi:SP family arabinose:H+ symporter-like MFS transporter
MIYNDMMMIISDKTDKRTLWICLAAAFGGLLFGFDTAVISGAIELIKTQFHLNAVTEGWLVSSGLLGSIIGVFAAGLLSDKVGRKKVLLLSAALFLISAIGCAMANSSSILILFRLIGGVGVGIASVISPMYITEFAGSKVRGRMVAFYQLAITIGILLAYFSNAWLLTLFNNGAQENSTFLFGLSKMEVWQSMFLVMALPSILFLIFILFVPESPRWLISKNRKEKALSILQKVNNEEVAAQTFKTIEDASVARGKSQRSVLIKEMRMPLFIGMILCIFQQFSGINAIIYYGPKIFTLAGLNGGNALQAQVIIGVVNVIFTTIAISQSDKFGRKPLLTIGLAGMILSLVMAGACFYTGNLNGIFLLTMLVLFIACFALSVGPVTWILINEIFPDDVRAKAVSICTFTLWSAAWLVGQFFPWLLEHVGATGVFWIFAGCSLLNLIFCRKILVETKGKTLEEIESIYVHPKTASLQ